METTEYCILHAGRYYVKQTEETWKILLEVKKQESASEHQKCIKNCVRSHARVSSKDEVPAGTYERDCQAVYWRARGSLSLATDTSSAWIVASGNASSPSRTGRSSRENERAKRNSQRQLKMAYSPLGMKGRWRFPFEPFYLRHL